MKDLLKMAPAIIVITLLGLLINVYADNLHAKQLLGVKTTLANEFLDKLKDCELVIPRNKKCHLVVTAVSD